MCVRQEELARILTLENGKTLKESRAEIGAAIKEMEFQIAAFDVTGKHRIGLCLHRYCQSVSPIKPFECTSPLEDDK